MVYKLANMVRQTSTSSGAIIELNGAARRPYMAFNEVLDDGDTTEAIVVDRGSGEWQAGLYSFQADVLTLVSFLDSSTGEPIDFSTGLKDVYIPPLAPRPDNASVITFGARPNDPDLDSLPAFNAALEYAIANNLPGVTAPRGDYYFKTGEFTNRTDGLQFVCPDGVATLVQETWGYYAFGCFASDCVVRNWAYRSPGSTQPITAISRTNPGVVSYTGFDPQSGLRVYIDDVAGMTELNVRYFKAANVNTASNTFELQDEDGVNVDTSAYGAYTSGGTFTGKTILLPNSTPNRFYGDLRRNRCCGIVVVGDRNLIENTIDEGFVSGIRLMEPRIWAQADHTPTTTALQLNDEHQRDDQFYVDKFFKLVATTGTWTTTYPILAYDTDTNVITYDGPALPSAGDIWYLIYLGPCDGNVIRNQTTKHTDFGVAGNGQLTVTFEGEFDAQYIEETQRSAPHAFYVRGLDGNVLPVNLPAALVVNASAHFTCRNSPEFIPWKFIDVGRLIFNKGDAFGTAGGLYVQACDYLEVRSVQSFDTNSTDTIQPPFAMRLSDVKKALVHDVLLDMSADFAQPSVGAHPVVVEIYSMGLGHTPESIVLENVRADFRGTNGLKEDGDDVGTDPDVVTLKQYGVLVYGGATPDVGYLQIKATNLVAHNGTAIEIARMDGVTKADIGPDIVVSGGAATAFFDANALNASLTYDSTKTNGLIAVTDEAAETSYDVVASSALLGSAYTSGDGGLVITTLDNTAPIPPVGTLIHLSSMAGTGAVASLNGAWPFVSGQPMMQTTLTAATGLGAATITGGTLTVIDDDETTPYEIEGGTYTSGSGALVIASDGVASFSSDHTYVLSDLTGTGAYASLNGTSPFASAVQMMRTTLDATPGLGAATITSGILSVAAYNKVANVSTQGSQSMLRNQQFKTWTSYAGEIVLTPINTFVVTADNWYAARGQTGGRVSRQDGTNTRYRPRIQRLAGNTSTQSILFAQTLSSDDAMALRGRRLSLLLEALAGANFSADRGILRTYLYTSTTIDAALAFGGFSGGVQTPNRNVILTPTERPYWTYHDVADDVKSIAVVFEFKPVGTAGASDYFELPRAIVVAGETARDLSAFL